MYALAKMAVAIADCRNQNPVLDNVGGSHSWDEVAAFLRGSLLARRTLQRRITRY